MTISIRFAIVVMHSNDLLNLFSTGVNYMQIILKSIMSRGGW